MRTIYAGTVEFLEVTVTADEVLDTQPVQFSFDRVEWYDADWTGIAGMSRTAELLVGDEVPLPGRGSFELFVRVDDSPEAIVFSAGRLSIR